MSLGGKKSYELRVEFAGLCLYVIDQPDGRRGGEPGTASKVGVVMPDARKSTNPVHPDGAKGEAHAGYIRFNLANISGFRVDPGKVDMGTGSPPNEVIHRFSNEEIDFGLGDAESPVEHEIHVPHFNEFTDGITPVAGLFGTNAPPKSVLMRTIINGGKLTATGSGKTWGFSPVLKRTKPENGGYSGQFGGFAVWRREFDEDSEVAKNGITVTIREFGGRVTARIPLQFVEMEDENRNTAHRITIKVANLCSHNPLEWGDFRLRNVVDRDLDFKWLYRLLKSDETLEQRLSNAELPYPREVSVQAYGDEDCMGGSITGRFP